MEGEHNHAGVTAPLTAVNFTLWLWEPTEDPTPLLKKKNKKRKNQRATFGMKLS